MTKNDFGNFDFRNSWKFSKIFEKHNWKIDFLQYFFIEENRYVQLVFSKIFENFQEFRKSTFWKLFFVTKIKYFSPDFFVRTRILLYSRIGSMWGQWGPSEVTFVALQKKYTFFPLKRHGLYPPGEMLWHTENPITVNISENRRFAPGIFRSKTAFRFL